MGEVLPVTPSVALGMLEVGKRSSGVLQARQHGEIQGGLFLDILCPRVQPSPGKGEKSGLKHPWLC